MSKQAGAPGAEGLHPSLRLLRSPALVDPAAGGRVHALSGGDAALLAYLSLHGDTPRGRLATLLWPDRPAGKRLTNLRQRVHRLNHWAGLPLLQGGDDTLALAAGVEHDLPDPAIALRENARALDGPLLGDFAYDADSELGAWVATERERWRARLRDALLQFATERESDGRIAEGLSYATRLVAEEPVLEHGVRVLMRLHHRRGDRGAALEAYDRCVRDLHEQLGEPPSEETSALAQAIGSGDVPGASAFVPVPLPLRHPPRIIGRAEALAAAERRLQDGGVALISGPAGIGKTRLFDELVARRGVRVVCRLIADDAGTDLALARRLALELVAQLPAGAANDLPVLRWLANPRSHDLPPGALRAERLVVLLREVLAAAAQAGLHTIAIDDLHFADKESATVLRRLLPVQPGPAGPQWLLTSRDGQLPEPLRPWLDGLDGEQDPQIELEPLDDAQLAEFVASIAQPGMDAPRWAAALYGHCGGHPQAVLQVLRGLHDRGALTAPAPPAQLPMPRDAMRHVLRRLSESDPAAQQLAFVAALAGADFGAELACRLLKRSATELAVHWHRLEALGVLRGDAFSHQLIRQAVQESLPAALVPAIRREIAEALAEAGRSPGRRALHWEAAGEWRRAAEDFMLAAEASRAVGLQPKARDLLLHAAGLFERAACAAPAFDARLRAAALTLACDSATTALAQATRLIADATDDRQRCLALCLKAQVHTEQHDDASMADASAALALAERLHDPALLARARLREAGALYLVGRPAEALERLEALQLKPSELGADELRELEGARSVVLSALGRLREVYASSLAARDQALAAGDLAVAAEHAGNAAVQLGYLCRTGEAIELSAQAISLARRAGVELGYLLIDEMTLAGTLQDAGRFGEALTLLERVARELREAGYLAWALNAENSLASLFVQLGRPDLAQQRLADAPADSPTWARAARRATQARLLQLEDRSRLAGLQEAAALLAQGGAQRNPYIRYRIGVEVARWSEPDAAAEQAADCRQWAIGHEYIGLARYAGWVEVDALLRAGRAGAAVAQADRLAVEIGSDWQANNFYLPDLWWTLVRAWDTAGQAGRADALAADAMTWIADCAEKQVPPVFRQSFLERNPANRALLARAAPGR